MKKLWRVEVSRTASETVLVYAEDQEEAESVAQDEAREILEGPAAAGEFEVEATEISAFWPDAKLPVNERLRAARAALPRGMEKELPYGDFSDLGEGGDDLTGREILERLIAERLGAEARAAEEAKQGKLFGGGK